MFDAYGTLLDVGSAVAREAAAIGPRADELSALWRRKQLEYSWLRSLMRRHADFWQLTQDGFNEFNKGYVAQHEKWGLRIENHMQAARTNVAPELDPPSGPCLRAFCYTEEAAGSGRRTFVISGAPEPPGTQNGLWEAMEKIMDERIQQLGVSWDDVNDVQFYGPRAEHAEVARAGRRFDGAGVRWFYALPPIEGLRLELDVRGLARDTFA